MAHGITLKLREIKPAPPEFVHEHDPAVKDRFRPGYWRKPDGLRSHVNLDRDKKRRNARLRKDAVR